MTGLIFVIVGIIMFAITLFVHRHTYEHVYSDKPLSLPRWLYWIVFLIALTPVLNVIVFISGATVYMVHWVNDEIYFKNNSKWWIKLSEFLNKDV